MASTMETFAKVAGVTSMATGGLDKIRKILSGEAKMLKNQQKRQRLEEKDQKALIIAEEKDIHANWLREKGSLIQAIKDDASGYNEMSEEERELNEELRIEKVKTKQKDKMIRDRRWAFELGGLKEEDFIQQHQFNIEIKAARQAEKDLKKAEKASIKKDELRIASLASEYHRLGAFDGLDKKAIAASIRTTEAKEAAAAKEEEIALIQEKYLAGSNVRLNKLVASLENEGMFATKSKDQIKALILAKELTDKQNARKEEILKGEEDYLGFVQERTGGTGAGAGAGAGAGTGGGTGPDVEGAGAGFGSAEIVQAIEEQTDEIGYGLGTNSPPFLETLTEEGVEVTNAPTEVTNAPTVDGENIGVESAPDTNGVNGSDVVQPVILTDQEGDPVITESEQMTSLLAIEDKKMDYLRRGEARDVKKMRLAVEAGRDKGRGLPKAPGGPMLNKVVPEKGGGLLSTLGKIFMSPLGRIGMALTGLTTGVGVLGTATGLLTTATTSMGSFANKLLPNWMKKMLPAPGSPTVGGPGVGRGNATGSKATQFKKAGKETAKAASKISKNARGASKLLGRAAVPLAFALEAFNMFSNEQDESLDRTEKNIKHTESVGGMAGAAGGASMGAAIGTVIFPGVGTIIGGMIGGGLGYFLGGEISKTVAQEVSDKTNLATADERLGELPEADQKLLMKEAERQGAVDVGLGHGTITDLEKLSKLDLSSIESLLDQETWEKEDKEQLMKIRAAKKEGRELNFKDGGFWDDDTLTAGEKGTAKPSVNVEEKLVKLREKKKARGRGYQEWGGYKKEEGKEETREMTQKEQDQLDVDYAKTAGEGVDVEDQQAADEAQKRLDANEYKDDEKKPLTRIQKKKQKFKAKMKKKKLEMQGKGTVIINGKKVRMDSPEAKAAAKSGRESMATDHAADERAEDSPAMEEKKDSPTVEPDPGTGTLRLNADGTVAKDQGAEKKVIKTQFMKDNAKFEYGKTTTLRKKSKDFDEFGPTKAESKLQSEEWKTSAADKAAEKEEWKSTGPGMDMSHEADTTADNYAVIKAAQEKYLAYQAAQTSGEPGSTVETLTPKTFDELTPQKELQDTANTAMTTEGSIFTHDTHLENALWSIWAEEKSFFDPKTLETSVGIEGEKELPFTTLPEGDSGSISPQMDMFGNAGELMPIPVIDVTPGAPAMGEAQVGMPSGMLEQSLITKMMEMQTQAETGGSGAAMVNAPTTVNKAGDTTVIQASSSAHAGVVKPGTGRG